MLLWRVVNYLVHSYHNICFILSVHRACQYEVMIIAQSTCAMLLSNRLADKFYSLTSPCALADMRPATCRRLHG